MKFSLDSEDGFALAACPGKALVQMMTGGVDPISLEPFDFDSLAGCPETPVAKPTC